MVISSNVACGGGGRNSRTSTVNVAIGCDGPASNDSQDMLEAIKLATMLTTLTTFECNTPISNE